jgi:phosphoribosylformylglycinamidine cyclo-ligase
VVELIKDISAGVTRPEVVAGVGGFAGLLDLGDGRLLVAATDGVGTKLEVARLAGRLGTVGIDLVAMCANDVACAGGEPLFFLDYLATGAVVPEEVASIVAGVAEGCRRAGCALLGGETAEHPGVLSEGRFDLAGFCVGVVRREQLLGPHRVRAGDVLLALPSTGLHANGFSLVRRAMLDAGYSLDQVIPAIGRTLGQELLEPTAIYVDAVLALAGEGLVHAVAHITGGGLPGNLPRVLPEGMSAELDWGSWPVPPVFDLLQDVGRLPFDEMLRVFNLGLGLVFVTPAGVTLQSAAAREVGRVVPRQTERVLLQNARLPETPWTTR